MKWTTLTLLLSVLVFCDSVSGYELSVSWVEGVDPPDFGIIPAEPTSTDLIYFTIPTDTFPDQLTAEDALGGTATLSIQPATRTIRLRFQGEPSAPFSEFAPPVGGLRGYFGPLEQGTWLFDVQFPGTFWQVNIDVNPPTIFSGVKAEYFEDTIPQGTPCWTQFEPGINNNWGNNEVACGRSDYVSARWTATLAIPANDTYTFYTNNDNGVRLYIDRRRIIDDWNDSGIIDHQSIPLTLEEGFYPLVMEWYHNSGTAIARLYWETSTMTRQIIPADQLIAPQLDPSPDQVTAPNIEPEGFEHFSDDILGGHAIFQTWIGGPNPLDPDINDNDTGMRVGHPFAPYVEETIVYSGEQSMPLYYDNSSKDFSQADRTWDTAQNWTEGENINYRNYLSLQVHGKPGNERDPFYIRVEDTEGRYGVVFNTDPDILVRNDWTSWWIPLSDFADAGVDLTQVKKLSIGMGEPPIQGHGGLLNDDWFNATPIGDVTDLAFDTTYATNDGYDNNINGPNIWFCYTASCNGPVTVSLCGSSYDTKLDIYDDCYSFPSSETTIKDAYNDDFCDLQSQTTFVAIKNHKYLIEVGGFDDSAGRGQISIWCGLAALIEPDLLSAAEPVGPIHSSFLAAAHLDEKVSDISYEADLPSQNLSDGPKLLYNPDIYAIIDQLAIFGIETIPALARGKVRGRGNNPYPNARVAFVLQGGWIGEFWDETDTNGDYEVQLCEGTYDVTVTDNGGIIQDSTPLKITLGGGPFDFPRP